MKLAFFLSEEWEKEHLEKSALAGEHELVFFLHPLLHDNVPDGAKDADVLSVFVDSVVDASMIDHFPNLKHIATRSTGYDHVDLQHATGKGITLSTVPAYGANTVAEHAFALLLTLSKRTFDGYEQVREGRALIHMRCAVSISWVERSVLWAPEILDVMLSKWGKVLV